MWVSVQSGQVTFSLFMSPKFKNQCWDFSFQNVLMDWNLHLEMHLESRSFHDPKAAFYQKLGSESVSVLSGQALSVYSCHPNSKLDFVLTHDHGDVNHFLLAHIISKPTSRAKEIVFWQSLFGILASYLVTWLPKWVWQWRLNIYICIYILSKFG